MQKFKVGDRVNYVSGNHGDGVYNPVLGGKYGEVAGTVVGIDEDNWIIVDWDNGADNAYKESDLELVIENEYGTEY